MAYIQYGRFTLGYDLYRIMPDLKGPLSATMLGQATAQTNKQVREAAIVRAMKMCRYCHFDAKTRESIGKCCKNKLVLYSKTTVQSTSTGMDIFG